MSHIMVVLDGIQDISYDILGGKTPYEAGKGEAFQALEEQSAHGFLDTTPKGFEPDTQTCTLTLLGVAPDKIPGGRSYVEALALGLDVGEDDIIMRCNFVKVDEDGNLEVPCCAAPEEVAKALRAAVAARPGHSVTPVGAYKSLQRIEGEALSLETLVTSTPHQHQGKNFESLLPRGNVLAEELAAFSREQLALHKPYTVLNWGAAVRAELPSFGSLHGGMRGGMISKTDAPIGISVAMGMDFLPVETATGDTDTDLAAKLDATLALAEKDDFVLLHVGGPDEATHRQTPQEKAEFIARLDRELIGPLMARVPAGTRVMVTSDHEALCSTAGHTDKPVAFWLWEKGKTLQGEYGVRNGGDAVAILTGK
ncbi:MAG: alkaline phosphatase family protein [Oscillospiraceae bacterium]